jgi:hypothetical protein
LTIFRSAQNLWLSRYRLIFEERQELSITKSTTKETENAFGAELSYNLSLSLLQIKGKEFTDDIFTQELMTSLIHLVQWRRDPKTSLGTTNERAWDASVANCLLLLSMALWRPDEILKKAGIDLKALSQTTLMLARPGKAPRKAIDFRSALNRIIESGTHLRAWRRSVSSTAYSNV